MKVGDIKQVAVVGAGLMGAGIAQEFALAGFGVHLHSRTSKSLQGGLERIQANLQMLVKWVC